VGQRLLHFRVGGLLLKTLHYVLPFVRLKLPILLIMSTYIGINSAQVTLCSGARTTGQSAGRGPAGVVASSPPLASPPAVDVATPRIEF